MPAAFKTIRDIPTTTLQSELRRRKQFATLSNKRKSIDHIIAFAEVHFGLAPGSICQKTRIRPIAYARMVTMVVTRERLGLTLQETAAAFNRHDHGTVIHARNMCNGILARDYAKFNEDLDGELARLKQRAAARLQ